MPSEFQCKRPGVTYVEPMTVYMTDSEGRLMIAMSYTEYSIEVYPKGTRVLSVVFKEVADDVQL